MPKDIKDWSKNCSLKILTEIHGDYLPTELIGKIHMSDKVTRIFEELLGHVFKDRFSILQAFVCIKKDKLSLGQ